jgi:hypothetical protein
LLGSTLLTKCILEGDLESSIWKIPDHQDKVIGAIGLMDCALVGCRLADIGFGVKSADVGRFREGFGPTP